MSGFDLEKISKISSIFTPITLGLLSISVAIGQLWLSKRQQALSSEQKDIARENKNIANQKLRLDLFNNRFDVYKSITDYAIYILDMPKEGRDFFVSELFTTYPLSPRLRENREALINSQIEEALSKISDIKKNMSDLHNSCLIEISKSRFLFNENVYTFLAIELDKITEISKRYSGKINDALIIYKESERFNPSYIGIDTKFEQYEIDMRYLETLINFKLPQNLSPFLNVEF